MPTLMIHHRKRLILKKLTKYARMRRLYEIAQSYTQANLPQQSAQDDDEQFHMTPGADLPFDQIPFMSKYEREKLQEQFPNLPPYIFMTYKQKVNFFKKTSDEYNKKLTNSPSRESKTKKIVKFNKFFEVRPFQELEIASKVKNTKSFEEKYQSYHFS